MDGWQVSRAAGRNSTIEVLRIILMLMIITLHYLYTGGYLIPFALASQIIVSRGLLRVSACAQ